MSAITTSRQTPSFTFGERTVSFSLSTIDRLEQEFGVSAVSIAEQVQGHFEKYPVEIEVDGQKKTVEKMRMTSKSLRIGFAARFLGAILDTEPDQVTRIVPRNKIIETYAEALDPFFEAIQQLVGGDEGADAASPTPAGTSAVSGASGPGLAST